MLESLMAVLGGGATGLLGTVISAGAEWLREKQRHAHEVALRRLDLEIMTAEAASAERIAAVERETEETRAGHAALAASYQAATTRMSRGDSRWLVAVDVVRGLTRPALTWAFVVLTGAMYFTAGTLRTDLGAQIVDTTLYLATTCVLWWFGARHVGRRR